MAAKPAAKSSAVKSADILTCAAVLFAACAGVLYGEATFLNDSWTSVKARRASNAKAAQENRTLNDDLTDIGRAEAGIKAAFSRLNDGTIRPVASKGGAALPSLADNTALRRPAAAGASTGPVFNIPSAAREPLPLQLGTLDSAGLTVIPQPVGTGERTRVFDAFAADGMEFNRFVPMLYAMENAYPLMEVEEVRASLPPGVPPFSPAAAPLDLKVRLRFPLAESASGAAVKAKPKAPASKP